MSHHLKAQPMAYALIIAFAYTPIWGSFNGMIASAQSVQNTTRTYQYDALGNLTQVTDPLSNVTNFSYDQLNRVKQQVQPVPSNGIARPISNLTYDALDQLNVVSDPRNLATIYTSDGLGNQSTLSSPDTGSVNRSYDAGGNLLTSTDARGKVSTYTYDILNRLTNIAFASGTPTSFEYDGGNTGATNAIGHLTKMTDESGQTTFGYDQIGRVLSKVQTTVSAIGTVVRTVSYAYDSTGKLTSLTYPSGNRILYGYDAAGNVSSLTLNPSDSAGGTDTNTATVLLDQISYAPFGDAQRWVWGNSTPTAPNIYTRTYDLDGRVVTYPLGADVVRTVNYDAASRITSITHAGGANAALYDQTFTYDGLGRLLTFVGSTSTQAYAYDANGNRTQLRMGAVSFNNTISTTSNKVSTTAGPYPAKSYQYDASGNPTSDGTISYTYNDHGRMKSSVNAGIVTSYLYNALGQRVSKTSSQIASGGSEFIYDEEGRLLGEYDASGGLIQETVYLGATPVSVLKQTHTGSPAVVGTSVYYVYADHIATPRGITSATTGELVWSWANTDPFGMNGPSENPSGTGTFIHNGRFPGQYYDTETNLFHNGFRDYDPQTGRFIESDFIGLAGGINTYAYGLNNPVSNADPTGLYCVSRGGWTSCSVPNGPSFTVPTPPGFPNILGPGADPDYHHYDITRSLNGANADCVFDQITSNPTPGDKPNRATPRGATNNAVVLGQDNIVTSYLTHDAVTGAAVEVNIAGVGDGSLFGPGYVARYVAGWWAHTAGEGNNFKQSPAVTGQTIQDIANQALWGEQMSGFIKKCGCKK